MTKKLRKQIVAAFLDLGVEASVADDIAFHMTDWEADLRKLFELFERNEEASLDEVQSTIIEFLAHVPNHVVAAKKLAGVGPTKDVFNVRLFEDD